jgi:hypothetical protein
MNVESAANTAEGTHISSEHLRAFGLEREPLTMSEFSHLRDCPQCFALWLTIKAAV